MSTALIIVDVQNDFCEGGSLAVTGGAAVAAAVSAHVATTDYDHVVATRDHHVDPGAHFSDHPDFVDSWPPHCRVSSPGASFHPNLDVAAIEAVFSKGEYVAAYSGFEGVGADGSGLAQWLRARDVDTVEIVGLATDHCVRATALDAAREDFATAVLLELTAGVAPETTAAALAEFGDAGIEVRAGNL